VADDGDESIRSQRRGWIAALASGAVVAGALASARPWPGAFLLRSAFERNAARTKQRLERHAPAGVTALTAVPYRPDDPDALLDVWFPASADETGARRPTLVWVHGGAWLSGHRDDTAPYFALVAAAGFTVVSVDYSLAPGHTYPTALHQVHAALAFVDQQADRLHVDPDRLVVGGDSAGAQLASQVAVLLTDPAYAEQLGLRPALRPDQLRGVVLYCGFYDLGRFGSRGAGPVGSVLRWGTRTMVRAYTGRPGDSATARELSTFHHVTAAYPPVLLSGGNADPLTESQSRPFAEKLAGLGVDVTTHFYEPDHEPELGHEYQFDLDTEEGNATFDRLVGFLRRTTATTA